MSSTRRFGSLGGLLLFGVMAGLASQCSSQRGGGINDESEDGGESGGSAGGAGGAGSGGAGGTSNPGGSGVAGAGGGGGATQQGGGAGTASTGGAGAGGGSGGRAGGAGGAPAGGAGGSAAGGSPVAEDKRPLFSFFTTSKDGILSFSANKNEAKTDADVAKGLHLGGGLGGDLGGLAGADNICTMLAKRSNPGDKKVWRAFLSASANAGLNGMPVNAIDRVGKGPWYNFKGILLAKDIPSLIPSDAANQGRPKGGDPALAVMFTDENGDNVRPSASVDNHDILTGSDKVGRFSAGEGSKPGYGTCNDWTSVDTKLAAPMIGHSWPRSDSSGRHWVSEHTAGGCGRGIDYVLKPSNNTQTVGSGGGYGGFYCFAVNGI